MKQNEPARLAERYAAIQRIGYRIDSRGIRPILIYPNAQRAEAFDTFPQALAAAEAVTA